jgi:tetratricopeptide (TPR) repeat protein
MVKAVFESIAETPPTKTHPLDAVLIERELRDARQALSEDRIRDAYKAAKQAHEKALTGDALKTRCHEYLELVEALGRDQLAQAMRAVEEKDFTVAVELLTDTMREFKDMDVATSARRKLESLKKKYEEVARVISQESEASQAERLLAQAIEALRAQPRRIGEAYEKLEQIVNDFAATPAASRAQTVLDRMKENVGVMAYVGDHKTQPECERLLSQARSFEQVGRTSDAKRLYRQIIDQYGETIWADEAARRLAQLP